MTKIAVYSESSCVGKAIEKCVKVLLPDTGIHLLRSGDWLSELKSTNFDLVVLSQVRADALVQLLRAWRCPSVRNQLNRKPYRTRLYFHTLSPFSSEARQWAGCNAFAGEAIRIASGHLQLVDIFDLLSQPPFSHRERHYCKAAECPLAFGADKLKSKLHELMNKPPSAPAEVQRVRQEVLAEIESGAPVVVGSDTLWGFEHDVNKVHLDRPRIEERLWRLIRADMIMIDDERCMKWFDLLSRVDLKSGARM